MRRLGRRTSATRFSTRETLSSPRYGSVERLELIEQELMRFLRNCPPILQ
jgi:hypothetical protein